MRVLGIDPGIAITGYSIVEETQGKVQLIEAQAVMTPSGMPFPERLLSLYEKLGDILRTYRPDVMSLEQLFFNTNAKTALIVGQARGVVQLAAVTHRVPIVEYTPLQVKMSLTGYGRADKSQIQQMVKTLLKLPGMLTPDDVADAAAIALTHCFSYKMQKHITKNK